MEEPDMTYRDPNPAKLSWHTADPDFEDSPYVDDYGIADHERGNHSTYSQAYDDVSIRKPPRLRLASDTDLDEFLRLRANPEEAIRPWQQRVVDCPESATFVWRMYVDPSQDTRNKIYFGKITTRTQTIDLWGLTTWVEFNSHLAREDKVAARVIRDEIIAEVATMSSHVNDYSVTYWMAKNQDYATRPGFWAIIVKNIKENTLGIYARWGEHEHSINVNAHPKQTAITFNFKEE